MPIINIRKRSLSIEMIFHEGGPPVSRPILVEAACAVINNPYAGRFEPDLFEFMEAVKPLGESLADELVRTLGTDQVEAYGKAAIVGVNGEMEHDAVCHEAGGWAMREALGEPKAIVPSVKAVACMGYRLMVPLHHVRAAYMRSLRSESRMRRAPTRFCSRWSCPTVVAFIREWVAWRQVTSESTMASGRALSTSAHAEPINLNPPTQGI